VELASIIVLRGTRAKRAARHVHRPIQRYRYEL